MSCANVRKEEKVKFAFEEVMKKQEKIGKTATLEWNYSPLGANRQVGRASGIPGLCSVRQSFSC